MIVHLLMAFKDFILVALEVFFALVLSPETLMTKEIKK